MATLEVKTFYHEPTHTLTYGVWDPQSLDAVVIDPVLDFDPLSGAVTHTQVLELEAWVKKQGLRVHRVVDTHIHADHLSGAHALSKRLGVPMGMGARVREVQEVFAEVFGFEGFDCSGSQWDELYEDGQEVPCGSFTLKALNTPGHTPACLSYVMGDCVFTGDALFMPDSGTGRCDFPRGDARTLFESITGKVYTLPKETRVFVGHDYQPQGRELRWESSVGEEMDSNIHLTTKTSLEGYVNFRTSRDGELRPPALLYPSIQVNMNGGRPVAWDPSGKLFLKTPLQWEQL